jgi:hypothetical protein
MRERLASAHAEEPFSPLDPRSAARRAAGLVTDLGLSATLYRGGLDLRGVEVDHVWLAASADGQSFVVDAAFPLFSDEFVDLLRWFVCGDTSREELASAAADSPLDDRVVGVFPPPLRYLGAPVWSAR